MLNQVGGSRTDTLIKLVLIFFISLLSFSVGTFVGKQFSDSHYKQAQLNQEYDESSNRSTASIPDDSLEVKPEDALTEKDVKQLAEEFTQPAESGQETAKNEHVESHGSDSHGSGNTEDSRNVASTESTQHSEHQVHGEAAKKDDLQLVMKPAKGSTDAMAAAADRVAGGLAPTENKQPPKSALPEKLPDGVAASSIGKFTVQVSSHQTDAEAEDTASKLRAKGLRAFVIPATVNGKKWYRVSVGLFETNAEAKSHRDEVLRTGGVTAAIVQKIVQ